MQNSVRLTGTAPAAAPARKDGETIFKVLAAISFCHLLNDLVQSLIPSIYPMLKVSYGLNFAQIGLITLAFQLTGSLLQPLVGSYTDAHPLPYSLPAGMGLTLCGLLLLSVAPSFIVVILAAGLVGMGSSVFHPESSRVARLASGGRHGLAQSVFQVGGNAGSAIGPLLAALIVLKHGQKSVAWFSVVVLLAIVILLRIGRWYGTQQRRKKKVAQSADLDAPQLSSKRVAGSIAILLALIFSKYFYLASLTNYYEFYLMSKFHVSVGNAQLHLFVFLGAAAVGTYAGGPLGDRIGRKYVIWGSILGVLPFTLLLPYVDLFWTGALSIVIGLILASAFAAILVYATELMPGKVGAVAGLFFGFAFGMAGVGAAVLGELADKTSIFFVYHVCSFLPLIGLLAGLLPDIETSQNKTARLEAAEETADYTAAQS